MSFQYLGPNVIATAEGPGEPGSVINWMGVNYVPQEPRQLTEPDQRPHSRACGYLDHSHGTACSSNCPTCYETDLPEEWDPESPGLGSN
jgi:hypothetical protein